MWREIPGIVLLGVYFIALAASAGQVQQEVSQLLPADGTSPVCDPHDLAADHGSAADQNGLSLVIQFELFCFRSRVLF